MPEKLLDLKSRPLIGGHLSRLKWGIYHERLQGQLWLETNQRKR